MTTIANTPTTVETLYGLAHSVVWTPLTAANADGTPWEMPVSSDRSIQFTGTFDSATAIAQGSNDGTNWITLHDPLGNTISLTATGLKQVAEVTRYIRPNTSGGGASQSLTATLIAVRKAGR